MKTINTFDEHRREFISKGVKIALFSAITGTAGLSGCDKEKENENEKKIAPPEDLMQEHGVLNRILLIYDACRIHLINKESFSLKAITDSANIIRKFVEDYHEKQEEEYLFSRFEKANQLKDLIAVLRNQHSAGRIITDQIINLSGSKSLSYMENQKLIQLLTDFNTMYRPHEAREDTVLFPTFRKIVSSHEYDSLGEEFEENEHKLFGSDGFETIVNEVADIEKTLGIYDLAQFTRL
jgi:hemerythrin-like domain-containing protein